MGTKQFLAIFGELKFYRSFKNFGAAKGDQALFERFSNRKKAQEHAKRLVKRIGTKEKIITVASLDWAEGSKGDLSLTNTDPVLIKAFVEYLKELGVGKDMLTMNLRIYEDLDQELEIIRRPQGYH